LLFYLRQKYYFLQRENPIGEPFIELSEVDSSNNYAMRQVQARMAGHGTTWFAWHQKEGRGQRGKVWNAEPGQNIILTTIAEPVSIVVENQFILNAIISLACLDFFEQYTAEIKIKWPNDIYWRDRKAGGILIENLLRGAICKFSVIGIGININQTLFPGDLPNPVSLTQITGKTYNVIELAKELCTCMEDRWQQSKVKSQELLKEYSSRLYKLGEKVAFKKVDTFFDGIVTGVNIRGELLIDTGDGQVVPFKSVEWLTNQRN
jgi:BirA family biotin operon repressor/biotin-[acetyl-CoA-carboxylase] ligase